MVLLKTIITYHKEVFLVGGNCALCVSECMYMCARAFERCLSTPAVPAASLAPLGFLAIDLAW